MTNNKREYKRIEGNTRIDGKEVKVHVVFEKGNAGFITGTIKYVNTEEVVNFGWATRLALSELEGVTKEEIRRARDYKVPAIAKNTKAKKEVAEKAKHHFVKIATAVYRNNQKEIQAFLSAPFKKEEVVEEAAKETAEKTEKKTFVVTICVKGDLPIDATVKACDEEGAVADLTEYLSDVEEEWDIVKIVCTYEAEEKEEEVAEEEFTFAIETEGHRFELTYDAPSLEAAQRVLVQDCQATFGDGQWILVEKKGKEGEPVYEALVNLDGEGEGVVIEFSASSEKEVQENIAGIKDAGWNVIRVSHTNLQRFRFTVETSCSSGDFVFYDTKTKDEAIKMLKEEYGDAPFFEDSQKEVE